MFFVSIIFLTIFIPSIQSLEPKLKLTFIRDEKYYRHGEHVEIICELINPNEQTESPQLWHVDVKSNRRTAISRVLFSKTPSDDTPDVFKQNKNKRFELVKKNHLHIKRLQVEDSARYECNCPDCDMQLGKQTKELQVMKIIEPVWHIGPGWPLQEHATTTIRCTTDDFYPYVSHKIIHRHHLITNEGQSTIPDSNTYPQKFSWEATVSPTADWHNTTLRCTVTEGNTELHALKQLEVLFSPRFLRCDQIQDIDSTKEKSSIECSYSGNPPPKLTWVRQTDEKSLTSNMGITIETKDEHHGKYKSIVTFNRDKLIAIPLTTTSQSQAIGDNYYQQLLNDGFIVKLTYNNEVKGAQKINVVYDAKNLARSEILDSSTTKTIQNLSISIILFLFLITLWMI